jgi:hypothetical protein
MSKEYNKVPVKNNMNVEVEVDNNDEIIEPKEKLTKLVEVQPKKVKRNLFGRLIAGIMGPDGLPGIGAYVNEEIVKPAVKNIIYDAITSGVGRALNMDYRHPRSGGRPQQYSPSTNYSNKYPPTSREYDDRRVVRPTRYGVEEYILEDRFEASNILISLTEYADRYNIVSVADYYETIGVPSRHTDHNYGWTIDSITKATIIATRGGFIIKFPPVEAI